MKRLGTAVAISALALTASAGLAPTADAAAVYKLTKSYGHGEFQAHGEWLCVKDDRADGKGVKIKLSWYEGGYHEVVMKAPPSAEPATCENLSFPEGQKMQLTLSRSDGSNAVSRSVTA